MSDTANMRQARAEASGPITSILRLYDRIVATMDGLLAGWFNGFAARFAFASLLLLYYLNSGWNKLGDGPFGFLHPSVGAYASILPPVFEKYGFVVEAVPFFPWGLVVILGTLAEITLPILIVLGLFGRIAAAGMIVFVIVQSYVDVTWLGLEDKYVGAMFDRLPDAIIFDQRMLWIFVLLMIVVNGPGRLSLDHLLARRSR